MSKHIKCSFIKRSLFKKFINLLTVSVFIFFAFTSSVFAAQPTIVTGTVNLLKAISTWLLIIIPLGAGVFIAVHAFKKSTTDDQAEIAVHNKMIKNTIIGAIVAVCADGLIAVILGFYS